MNGAAMGREEAFALASKLASGPARMGSSGSPSGKALVEAYRKDIRTDGLGKGKPRYSPVRITRAPN